jgi:hypothetical protein
MRKLMLASGLVAVGLLSVGCDSPTSTNKAGNAAGASGAAAGAKAASEKNKEAAEKMTAPTPK